MNNFESWAQWSISCEQLRVVDDMNISRLCALGSKYYKQLKALDDMNDSGS